METSIRRRHAPYSLGAVKCDHSRTHVAVPPLPKKASAFRGPHQSKDSKKKLSEITRLLDELSSMLTTDQQKEKLEQIENGQLSLIALSEKDAYIEGFKLGVRMATEIYANTPQRGWDVRLPRCSHLYADVGVITEKGTRAQHRRFVNICEGVITKGKAGGVNAIRLDYFQILLF